MDRAARTDAAARDQLRRLPPWLFAAVISAFFLPFVTCDYATVNGVQAATALSPPGSDPAALEQLRGGQVPIPNPLALLALLAAGAGFVFTLVWGLRGLLASVVATFVGVLGLFGAVLWAALAAHGELTTEFGLHLTFLLFLLAGGAGDYVLARAGPLLAEDAGALRQLRAGALRWFAVAWGAVAIVLFVTAAVSPDNATPYMIGLSAVVIVAFAELVFGVRSFPVAHAEVEGSTLVSKPTSPSPRSHPPE